MKPMYACKYACELTRGKHNGVQFSAERREGMELTKLINRSKSMATADTQANRKRIVGSGLVILKDLGHLI